MRALIPILLALTPAIIIQSTLDGREIIHHKPTVETGYAGRGFVNPPTVARMQEEKCLATMIYGEARGEPELGQVAVAYTAVNRAVNRSVCDVILAPKQYSIFNDNPSLRAAALSLHIEPRHKNVIDKEAWPKAIAVAKAVLRKKVDDPTKGSTHYLAPIAMEALGYEYPEWSKQYKVTAVIHGHKFFKYAPPPKVKKEVMASL